MELELKRPSKIKVKLDGETYEMSKVNLAQAQAFDRKVRELRAAGDATEGQALESIRSMIVGQGMPEAVVDSLELELLFEIAEALKPGKKN